MSRDVAPSASSIHFRRSSTRRSSWAGPVAGGSIGTGGCCSALGMLGLQFCIGAVNDLLDERVDALAKPWKPIPSGLVSRRTADGRGARRRRGRARAGRARRARAVAAWPWRCSVAASSTTCSSSRRRGRGCASPSRSRSCRSTPGTAPAASLPPRARVPAAARGAGRAADPAVERPVRPRVRSRRRLAHPRGAPRATPHVADHRRDAGGDPRPRLADAGADRDRSLCIAACATATTLAVVGLALVSAAGQRSARDRLDGSGGFARPARTRLAGCRRQSVIELTPGAHDGDRVLQAQLGDRQVLGQVGAVGFADVFHHLGRAEHVAEPLERL